MKHSTAPKVQLFRIAAIDRDTTTCPKAPHLRCVPFDPWAIDPYGDSVGDCLRCGQPTYMREGDLREARRTVIDQARFEAALAGVS